MADRWITVSGAHVKIDGKGNITQGPAHLKGKRVKVKAKSRAKLPDRESRPRGTPKAVTKVRAFARKFKGLQDFVKGFLHNVKQGTTTTQVTQKEGTYHDRFNAKLKGQGLGEHAKKAPNEDAPIMDIPDQEAPSVPFEQRFNAKLQKHGIAAGFTLYTDEGELFMAFDPNDDEDDDDNFEEDDEDSRFVGEASDLVKVDPDQYEDY